MSRTALITGSSNGIGYELARIHAEHGDNWFLLQEINASWMN